MSADARAELRRIGEGLDARQPVRVTDGGIVFLDPDSAQSAVLETCYEQRQNARRPAARSRQGAARRERPPGRPRPPGAGPWVGRLSAAYQQQLEGVQRAYPGAALDLDQHGVWLFARSQLLAGLSREAIFLVALPDTPLVEPRAWAFWQQGKEATWIGDRHTNFFDGSICAYSPTIDRAWSPGGDLRTLLDLYSLWALRHLHVEVLGRWPGKQYALLAPNGHPMPYYRLVEFKDDELCSCDSGGRYGACCKPRDLTCDFMIEMQRFRAVHGGRGIRDRRPPEPILRWALEGATKPRIYDAHELLQVHLARMN